MDKSLNRIPRNKKASKNTPREHQRIAFSKLDIINKKQDFSTLLVLPTGGGKTFTSCTWLLRNAIDKGYKVLWLAHRTFLLDQALDTFFEESTEENLPNTKEFSYRIVSGDKSRKHDYAINIVREDQLLLVSKDSIRCNLDKLEQWCKSEELYFVIDEAHHATAKTYRRIIDCVKENAEHVKLIGLTATPTRTVESEKGLLQKIFTDDIIYKLDLNNLINCGFLSKPVHITVSTNVDYGKQLGVETLRRINKTDFLPENLMTKIAESQGRNELIVKTYLDNKDKYQKTLVFALGKDNAAALCALFKANNVKADFVISDMRSEGTGTSIGTDRNKKIIEKYKKGEIEVLVNVNILTEGVDVPNTQSVFLTRPTISEILMTQMVGRALRGKDAGGTDIAYIVSFFDDWDNKVAWVNPSSIIGEDSDFQDNKQNNNQKKLTYVSLSKIEQFVKLLHDSIKTEDLQDVPFLERVPVGMYVFNYEIENSDYTTDKYCQILVYEHKKIGYDRMSQNVKNLFEYYKLIEKECLSENEVSRLAYECSDTFFYGQRMLEYEIDGLIDILNYYTQKGEYPTYYPIDEIERNSLDINKIAQHIVNSFMSDIEKMRYLDNLWNGFQKELLVMVFTSKDLFKKLIEKEIEKIKHPELFNTPDKMNYVAEKPEVKMSMYELMHKNREKYEFLVRNVYSENAAKYNDTFYTCECCKRKFPNKRFLQIDHIKPISKGGLTILSNLQVLCSSCNMRKSDKEISVSDIPNKERHTNNVEEEKINQTLTSEYITESTYSQETPKSDMYY